MKAKINIQSVFILALLSLWASGCTPEPIDTPVGPTNPTDTTTVPTDTTTIPTDTTTSIVGDIDSLLLTMSIREKVGQLFFVRPECLDTTIDMQNDDYVSMRLQAVNAVMRQASNRYPVGGIILYAHNIQDGTQLTRFVRQLHELPGAPLLCIDEEGGRVARIANNSNFNVRKYDSMAAIGATGDTTKAYECGLTIGTYLHRFGLDINFAPVADVNTNPDNIVIGNRAFSSDPNVAAPMVRNYLQGLKDAGVTGCIKHFPGHGDTTNDTHYGYAQTTKTWDEMLACEMIPFRAGIDWGCRLVMTAHIAAPNVTGTDVPSTMSSVMLKEKLRDEIGYTNLIITDGMEMGAITQQYSPEGAAVGCLLAGADIILGPQHFSRAFNAVVKAVENGRISEERLDESVRRILELKQEIR